VVLALFTFVPRRRGVARREGFACRSRHGVAMGTAVCARIAAVLAMSTLLATYATVLATGTEPDWGLKRPWTIFSTHSTLAEHGKSA